jgi:hypothetical protein
MTEWSNVLVLKASVPMVPWVRIPLCPSYKICIFFLETLFIIMNIFNCSQKKNTRHTLKAHILMKWSLLTNLSDRCFLIHIVLFNIVGFCHLSLYESVFLWAILFSLTALNEKFHLWFTNMHYKFLFSDTGLEFVYILYIFCVELYFFFQDRRTKWFVLVFTFFMAATISMWILDPSSVEYTILNWVVLIVFLMLRTYFKTVLVPIFHPVRFSSNPLESGRWQLRHFHNSRSLYTPFGVAGKEFVKSISKFSFGYPKSNFLAGVLGFSGPMAQKAINYQTSFNRNKRNEQAQFERKAANDQIAFENEQIAFDSMQARLKKTELNEQLAKYSELKQSACTPGNTFDKDVCQGYTEVFNIILEAIKKSL